MTNPITGARFGLDANGLFKRLADGRALRIAPRWHNTLLTLSDSVEDHGWSHGW
jgi:hypothetical protein